MAAKFCKQILATGRSFRSSPAVLGSTVTEKRWKWSAVPLMAWDSGLLANNGGVYWVYWYYMVLLVIIWDSTRPWVRASKPWDSRRTVDAMVLRRCDDQWCAWDLLPPTRANWTFCAAWYWDVVREAPVPAFLQHVLKTWTANNGVEEMVIGQHYHQIIMRGWNPKPPEGKLLSILVSCVGLPCTRVYCSLALFAYICLLDINPIHTYIYNHIYIYIYPFIYSHRPSIKKHWSMMFQRSYMWYYSLIFYMKSSCGLAL